MSSGSSKPREKNAIADKAVGSAIFNTTVLTFLLAINSVPSWVDLLFPVFASLYVYIMSRVAFPKPGPKLVGGWQFTGAGYLPGYVLFCAIIGLFLPLLQITIAYVTGDQATVRESAPHLFVLCAQVLTENLTFSSDSLALPLIGLIPALYNARRLVNLQTWAVAVFNRELSSNVSFASSAWAIFGRSLVVSNVILWHFNLWCFLLPFFVPWTLQTHFKGLNAHVE
ncbi:unnamed protein product [Calypogeia fissa]